MTRYSIRKDGSEYVVRVGETNILKVASRRRAAQLVTEAVELLDSSASPPLSPEASTEPSIACDPGGIPDPPEVP